MPVKRATFYTNGDDNICSEARNFIEGAGYILQIRDLKQNPLTLRELSGLIGYIDLKHFLNKRSDSYKKHKLGEDQPERNEVLKLIEADPTLLKMPIVKSVRLLTVGCNKDKIAQMLQISSNGNGEYVPDTVGNIRNGKNDRKHSTKRSSVSSK